MPTRPRRPRRHQHSRPHRPQQEATGRTFSLPARPTVVMGSLVESGDGERQGARAIPSSAADAQPHIRRRGEQQAQRGEAAGVLSCGGGKARRPACRRRRHPHGAGERVVEHHHKHAERHSVARWAARGGCGSAPPPTPPGAAKNRRLLGRTTPPHIQCGVHHPPTTWPPSPAPPTNVTRKRRPRCDAKPALLPERPRPSSAGDRGNALTPLSPPDEDPSPQAPPASRPLSRLITPAALGRVTPQVDGCATRPASANAW